MALWAIILLFVAILMLPIILILALVRFRQVQKVEQAFRHAWNDQGICRSHPELCILTEREDLGGPSNPLPTEYNAGLARLALDYLVRLTKPTDNNHTKALPVSTPPDHEQIHLFKALGGGPYYGVAYLYNKQTLVLVFRCTVTDRDIEQDMKMTQVVFNNDPKMLVHKGFHEIFMHYREEIHELIDTHTPLQVFVVGHSLGGGVATLVTGDLALSTKSFSLGSYVFGSPRVGNLGFAQMIQERVKIHTFWENINEADFVTDLPPSITPDIRNPNGQLYYYFHSGKNRHTFLDNWGALRKNHFLAQYINDAESYL